MATDSGVREIAERVHRDPLRVVTVNHMIDADLFGIQIKPPLDGDFPRVVDSEQKAKDIINNWLLGHGHNCKELGCGQWEIPPRPVSG